MSLYSILSETPFSEWNDTFLGPNLTRSISELSTTFNIFHHFLKRQERQIRFLRQVQRTEDGLGVFDPPSPRPESHGPQRLLRSLRQVAHSSKGL